MNPEVLVITPRVRNSPEPPVVKSAIRLADSKGWANRILRQQEVRDSAGKPICILDSEEARKLYLRAHRARLAVWTTTEVRVRLNPTRHNLDERYLAQLSQVVRYKAFFGRVSPENLNEVAKDYGEWMSLIDCTHERDPRVLPLHIFCPSADWVDLDDPVGRQRFATTYGRPARRTCEQDLDWTPDPSRHGGRDPEQVAGLDLSPGYHWDASNDRRARKLMTLTEVWDVPRGSHANVYPNGHVRGGKGSRVIATARSGSTQSRRSRKK